MSQTFKDFLSRLSRITRAPFQGQKAPHKPIFLLSIADWIERQQSIENTFPIDGKLVDLFKENWRLLVDSDYFKADITQPLFYLQNDGFWQLKNGKGLKMEVQLKSIKRLTEEQVCGQLTEEVFLWFQNPVARELIRMHVLDVFFPGTKMRYIQARGLDGFIMDIEADVLMEPAPRYERKTLQLREWEGYIRHHKFRTSVMQLYNETCCISGLRVENNALVEACHIKKHADYGINTVDNGLALCLNLHRAFDCGLIGLSDDFTVIVNKNLKESDCAYSLRQLNGKRMAMQKHGRWRPNREYLEWHRKMNGLK